MTFIVPTRVGTDRRSRPTARAARLALAVTLLLPLGACQGSVADSAPDGEPYVSDPWVKAADEGMTAAFGTLVNPTDEEIVLVAARTDLSPMELHETVAAEDGTMQMRRTEAGFTVPAGGRHELAPGADHLMLMDLAAPLLPGEEIEITLESQDGRTWVFTASARSFDGAHEEYVEGGTMEHGEP